MLQMQPHQMSINNSNSFNFKSQQASAASTVKDFIPSSSLRHTLDPNLSSLANATRDLQVVVNNDQGIQEDDESPSCGSQSNEPDSVSPKSSVNSKSIQKRSQKPRSQRFSRAKTGCYTCRARRKKCDENRDDPSGSCQRCLKSGIECLGFPKIKTAPLAAHTKKEKQEGISTISSASNATKIQEPTSATTVEAITIENANKKQRRSFDSQMINSNASFSSSGSANDSFIFNDIVELNSPSVAAQAHSQDVQFQELTNSLVRRTPSGFATPTSAAAAFAGNAIYNSTNNGNNSNNINNASMYDAIFSLAMRGMVGLTGSPSSASATTTNDSTTNTAQFFSASPLSGISPQDWQTMTFDQQQALSSEAFTASTSLPSSFPLQSMQTLNHPRNRPSTSLSIINALANDPLEADRAIKSLAAFYGTFCWAWWVPKPSTTGKRNKGRHLQSIVQAIEQRLQQSEIVCTTVACVAACYGFGNHITLDSNSPIDSFRQSWQRIYQVVCGTKKSNLVAYLDWLGSSNGNNAEHSEDTTMPSSPLGNSNNAEDQADRLFAFASKVLARVAIAAKQDQDGSSIIADISAPLEFSQLVPVDSYLQAAMDLTLFAYASRPARIFHQQFDEATKLLESLLGRGISVCLADLDGVDIVGFRTFVWTDITNAAVMGRSTRLHYLFNDKTNFLGSRKRAATVDTANGFANIDLSSSATSATSAAKKHDATRRNVQVSFGCPDEILILFAHITNLHFQLRHARTVGAIRPSVGVQDLPAWAVQSAFDLKKRIENCEQRAAASATIFGPEEDGDQGQRLLAAMWRHAAVIFLQTTAYRISPTNKIIQDRMRAILSLWTTNSLQASIISYGNPAVPLLFAAFVAQQQHERHACREALRMIGQHECSRAGYRSFIERLWCKSDEVGFAVLWPDLLDENIEKEIAIM